jgi:hypothetical protein
MKAGALMRNRPASCGVARIIPTANPTPGAFKSMAM